MLAFAPLAIGEIARWLLINPVIASFGFREIPFGSGVPTLLTASIGGGLFWYLAKIAYQVGVRFTGKTVGSAAPRTLKWRSSSSAGCSSVSSSVPVHKHEDLMMISSEMLCKYDEKLGE